MAVIDVTQHRHSVAFIVFVVLIDSVSFGIVLPVLPKLIVSLGDTDLSQASQTGGYLMFSYAAVQFFAAPVLGNLGDRYGRRPILLFSLLVLSIGYVLMSLATTLTWLFVARLIAGISSSTFALSYAYITDISPPEIRAQRFGLVGAAFGGGFVLGPVLGGFLGEFGAKTPFYAAAALALMNVVYGYFVLGESLRDEQRRSFDLRRANPLGAMLQIRRYPVVVGLAIAYFVYMVGPHGAAQCVDLLHHGKIQLVGKADRPVSGICRYFYDRGSGRPDSLGDSEVRGISRRRLRHGRDDSGFLRICALDTRLAAVSVVSPSFAVGVCNSGIPGHHDRSDTGKRSG